MSAERVIELESKLAFLEDTVRTLNDVVTVQQQDIDRLRAALSRVQQQLSTLDAPGVAASEEPPPHY